MSRAAKETLALLNDAGEYQTLGRLDDAGHLLICGIRRLCQLADDELGDVLVRLDATAARLAVGALAVECARAGVEPKGDD